MDKFKKLTEKLEGFLKMGLPFYDCVVMKDGECVYRRWSGFLEKDVKPTGDELYNIYSCSKLITCTAALQLYEKGFFSLDDPLEKYMPEFKSMNVKTGNEIRPAKNKITIEQLFTMTAGFSYDLHSTALELFRKETDGVCPTGKLAEYISREPLLFEPGYRWEYSLCHDVLAALVEVLSGMKFGEYVKKNIFDVAGMTKSTFNLSDAQLGELCPQYRYNEEKQMVEIYKKTNNYKIGTEYESGGAGCISCVDDYIKSLEAVRTYKLLKKETVDLMSTNRLTDEQLEMPTYWVSEKRGYGLGQQCPTQKHPRPDFGWGGTAGAHYFIDTSRGISAYLGTHVLSFEKFQQERTSITPIIMEVF